LVTQILLGILSKDLKPDQRLPSIRSLARMLRVHPNTVSGVYHELVSRGWLESRHGSGVYVRDAPCTPRSRVDLLVASFVEAARSEGWTDSMIRQSVECELVRDKRSPVVLFEPEAELRNVLIREIEQATGIRPGVSDHAHTNDVLTIALQGRAQVLEEAVPARAPRLLLQMISIPGAMLGQRRPLPSELIALASASHDIVTRAKTVLLAAGIDPSTIVDCDPREPGWQARALACDVAIADVIAGDGLGTHPRLYVFRVLSDEALQAVKQHCR
jgi:DNA-binding transcriptional regulator YhcF (GntR family)